ncbi:UPF0311 family protein [Penicillium ucsense]|uniref:UPF0311 family protein n=2 Tax=Penicillium TaxID=5073 RepID=A0A8J8W8N8_9EURO|nr:uncharacterized protein N7539_003438 [Penicillium diatomitis]KAF7717787.1 UPF0311 family protein [Penicillium ucsense]KAF7734931.1 UPF0311 family protein [Penicillium ucsense]KAJ5488548.1 hypothetical protein N7539_003438 [Penicillium diatomitis]
METLVPPPKLNHLFTLRCAVDPPVEIGTGPYGRRRCVPIKSGSVHGPHFEGEVVPAGGADFMLVEDDQTTHVNTNYVVKSNDGAYLYIRTEGTRAGPPEVLKALMEGGPVDPSQYWFHLHIKIETGHEKYKWMNNRVIVGRATRAKGEVAYDAYYLTNDD